MPSPGALAEWVTIFCGAFDSSNAGGTYGLAAEHEDIRAFVLPAREALTLVRRGRIENAFTVIALQWLALHRRRLRRRWRDLADGAAGH
jgi:ADP-ribose pyrophosphatase